MDAFDAFRGDIQDAYNTSLAYPQGFYTRYQPVIGHISVRELYEKYNLKLQDIKPFLPIEESILKEKEINIHYLGYYLKWTPQEVYYYAVENTGFKARPFRTQGTYSKYNSIDDKIDDLHYYTTGIKFGIGRASYDAAQEIRSGDITRDEGVALAKKFDLEFPSRFSDELFNYLSLRNHIIIN